MSHLTLSLIQTHTHWHDPAANRAHFEALLDDVPDASQLVVLPEMFSTGFTMASGQIAEDMDGETVAWLKQVSERSDRILCGSLVIRDDAGRCFNRFLWVQPDGAISCYDKRHLFRMAGEHEHYAAGESRLLCEAHGWRILPLVCYDLRFPVWSRNSADRDGVHDYDLLLCVANWPLARRDAWLALLRARAIENQAYVAGVNVVGTDGAGVVYGGGTAVYAPDGTTLAEALDQPQIVSVSLEGKMLHELRSAFPVWQDADDFSLSE